MPCKQSCTASETQLLLYTMLFLGTVNFSPLIQSELHASSSPLECRERRLLQASRELKRDKWHWVSFTCGLGLLEVCTQSQSVVAETGLGARCARLPLAQSVWTVCFLFLPSLKLDILLQIWKGRHHNCPRKSHSFNINGINEMLVQILSVPVSRDLKIARY